MKDKKKWALNVYKRLLDFYGEPQWPNIKSPIDELVFTILSQNTTDASRDRAYASLRKRFPTWDAVRKADPAEVIEAVRIAGFAHQKGPRIQNVLNEIIEERGSLDLSFLKDMPLEDARSWLMKHKGVGYKTAAIVLLFSMGRPAFPVDTHIYRVTGRVGLRPEKMTVEQTHMLMEKLLPPETYYTAHLNIIRLGREICKARNPAHKGCPLLEVCNYGRAMLKI